jgi:hypothetical protein
MVRRGIFIFLSYFLLEILSCGPSNCTFLMMPSPPETPS